MFLKECGGMNVSSLRVFCSSFQSFVAENWNQWQPKEVRALGMTSVISLPEHRLLLVVEMEWAEVEKGLAYYVLVNELAFLLVNGCCYHSKMKAVETTRNAILSAISILIRWLKHLLIVSRQNDSSLPICPEDKAKWGNESNLLTRLHWDTPPSTDSRASVWNSTSALCIMKDSHISHKQNVIELVLLCCAIIGKDSASFFKIYETGKVISGPAGCSLLLCYERFTSSQ